MGYKKKKIQKRRKSFGLMLRQLQTVLGYLTYDVSPAGGRSSLNAEFKSRLANLGVCFT